MCSCPRRAAASGRWRKRSPRSERCVAPPSPLPQEEKIPEPPTQRQGPLPRAHALSLHPHRLTASPALAHKPQGALLLKHGRHGKPKVHFFRVSACDTLLKWRSASGSVKQVGVGGWR
jgi:hypothetical protein